MSTPSGQVTAFTEEEAGKPSLPSAVEALRQIIAGMPVGRPATLEESEFVLATARNALAGAAHVTGQSTEWVVFWGGPSPDEGAGWDAYDDEADAGEHRQWIVGGGVACRTITYGPWTVTVPPPPADRGLLGDWSEQELAEFRRWREQRRETPLSRDQLAAMEEDRERTELDAEDMAAQGWDEDEQHARDMAAEDGDYDRREPVL